MNKLATLLLSKASQPVKMGRPPLPEGKAGVCYSLRLTPAEWRELDRLCALDGRRLSRSRYVAESLNLTPATEP